tara:strand:+ start:323 stop:712 length:390 start_codon:yes stop_codon:yes gene_type:complete
MGFFKSLSASHREAKQQAINLATKTVVGEIFEQSLKGASRQGVKFASVVLDEPIYEKTKTQSSWNFQILCECDRAFRFKNIMETEISYAFSQFRQKPENKSKVSRITKPEVFAAGDRGLQLNFKILLQE